MEQDADCAPERERVKQIYFFFCKGNVSKGDPSLRAPRRLYGRRTALRRDPGDYESAHRIRMVNRLEGEKQRVSY